MLAVRVISDAYSNRIRLTHQAGARYLGQTAATKRATLGSLFFMVENARLFVARSTFFSRSCIGRAGIWRGISAFGHLTVNGHDVVLFLVALGNALQADQIGRASCRERVSSPV